MTRKNMLTLAIAGVLATALVGCGESESEKAATTPEAKKSASAAQELTKGARTYEEAKMLQTGKPDYFVEVDLGNGFTAIQSGGGMAGRTYHLTGNFAPRDYTKFTYTPFSWPFDAEGQYQKADPTTLAVLEYFAKFFPKDEALKFYASYYYPEYRSGSHFDKQDLLNRPDVQAKLTEVFEKGLQRSLDVSIPVEFQYSVNLVYNPEKNRFEFRNTYLKPISFRIEVDPTNARSYTSYDNTSFNFMGFGVNQNGSDFVAEALEPGYEAKKAAPDMHFSLPEENTRELAKLINNNSGNELKYEYLGRLLHTSIRKGNAHGELLFAPDALRISAPNGAHIATLPMPTSVQSVHGTDNNYVSSWIQGYKTNNDYVVPGQPAAQ